MIVFTDTATYMYEIKASSESADPMNTVVREPAIRQPAPMQPVPTPQQVQKERDVHYADLLLASRPIATDDMKSTKKVEKHEVYVRIEKVSEDAGTYYVQMRATNNSGHVYRLQTPTVYKVDPAFGALEAYEHIDRQISPKTFKVFKRCVQNKMDVHGSTLAPVDLPADNTMEWVISFTKPAVNPSIFRFNFEPDHKAAIYATAIF